MSADRQHAPAGKREARRLFVPGRPGLAGRPGLGSFTRLPGRGIRRRLRSDVQRPAARDDRRDRQHRCGQGQMDPPVEPGVRRQRAHRAADQCAHAPHAVQPGHHRTSRTAPRSAPRASSSRRPSGRARIRRGRGPGRARSDPGRAAAAPARRSTARTATPTSVADRSGARAGRHSGIADGRPHRQEDQGEAQPAGTEIQMPLRSTGCGWRSCRSPPPCTAKTTATAPPGPARGTVGGGLLHVRAPPACACRPSAPCARSLARAPVRHCTIRATVRGVAHASNKRFSQRD